MKNSKQTMPINGIDTVLILVKGTALALGLLLGFLFLSAISIAQGLIPQERMFGVVLVCVVLSTLGAGYYGLSKIQHHGLLFGGVIGLLLFISLYLIGICVSSGIDFSNGGVEILFASICGGALSKLFWRKNNKATKFAKKS